jgi:hypothetical protein
MGVGLSLRPERWILLVCEECKLVELGTIRVGQGRGSFWLARGIGGTIGQ